MITRQIDTKRRATTGVEEDVRAGQVGVQERASAKLLSPLEGTRGKIAILSMPP